MERMKEIASKLPISCVRRLSLMSAMLCFHKDMSNRIKVVCYKQQIRGFVKCLVSLDVITRGEARELCKFLDEGKQLVECLWYEEDEEETEGDDFE